MTDYDPFRRATDAARRNYALANAPTVLLRSKYFSIVDSAGQYKLTTLALAPRPDLKAEGQRSSS
jgi:hypothetical protein